MNKRPFSIIYIILALYLLNLGFGFVTMPEFILSINKWILLVSGVLLLYHAIRTITNPYAY